MTATAEAQPSRAAINTQANSTRTATVEVKPSRAEINRSNAQKST